MSSYIEMEPVASATKLTPYVRIDNDFGITVVINENGTLTTHYYNLQGIPDEFNYKPNPPDDVLVEARIAKEGADESIVFRVNMFFDDNDDSLEDWQVPHAWIYSEPIDKDNYLPGELPETVSQSFPVVIWNQLTPQQTAPGANTASATVFERTYANLETLDRRRDYLKEKLRIHVESPMLRFVMAGSTLNPIVHTTTEIVQPGTSNVNITVVKELARRQQGFSFWLETLARAISVDSNLQTEQKFNLLNGELGLSIGNVFKNMPLSLNGDIADQHPRSGWDFRRFGSVASSTPWAYTAPTGQTSWSTTHESTIDIGSSVPDAVTDDWVLWLRS